MGAREFRDPQSIAGTQVTFAPKPIFHGSAKSLERNPKPGFEKTVAHRERVVEDGVIGKVAHGEVVDPRDRTGVGLTVRALPFNPQSTKKH
jgi:hypothetical protein